MKPLETDLPGRIAKGLGALTARGLGRTSLVAAAAAPLFSIRSPGAALLFALLPAYAVLQRGDFTAPGEAAPSPKGPVSPAEIPARLVSVVLAAAVSAAAALSGGFLARRLGAAAAPPWGLAAAGSAASLFLSAVFLPVLAAAGRTAARNAAGALFALTGLLAVAAALRPGSGYALFLLALYSGRLSGLSLGLLAGSSLLAAVSGAVSWAAAGKRGDGNRPSGGRA